MPNTLKYSVYNWITGLWYDTDAKRPTLYPLSLKPLTLDDAADHVRSKSEQGWVVSPYYEISQEKIDGSTYIITRRDEEFGTENQTKLEYFCVEQIFVESHAGLSARMSSTPSYLTSGKVFDSYPIAVSVFLQLSPYFDAAQQDSKVVRDYFITHCCWLGNHRRVHAHLPIIIGNKDKLAKDR